MLSKVSLYQLIERHGKATGEKDPFYILLVTEILPLYKFGERGCQWNISVIVCDPKCVITNDFHIIGLVRRVSMWLWWCGKGVEVKIQLWYCWSPRDPRFFCVCWASRFREGVYNQQWCRDSIYSTSQIKLKSIRPNKKYGVHKMWLSLVSILWERRKFQCWGLWLEGRSWMDKRMEDGED